MEEVPGSEESLLALDRGRVEAARGEQDVAVKPEVGELLDQALVALACAGERCLDPFPSDLARARRRPLVEQL